MTIASHALEIFRQGVWASLTGGWCYDPRQTLACNVVHMYLWLFLFALPLLIALCFNFTWPVIGVYALIVGFIFSVLKVLNYYLHTIFDTHDPIDVVVMNTNPDEEGDDEENGIRDVEEGVVMDDENQSDLDNRRALSEILPASTLYETLGENSLSVAASSSGGGVFPDDEELEYVTWESARGVANTATTAAALEEGEFGKASTEDGFVFSNQRKRGGLRKKPGFKKRTATTADSEPSDFKDEGPSGSGVPMPSSPDYLAVEADVHSMPNEPIAKDEVLDAETIELRTVRSDSKLPTSAIASGEGCSSAMTTADIEIMPGRKDEQSPGGKRILFQSNDIEISRSEDERGDEDEFGDDNQEDEDEGGDGDGVAEENADTVASSSSSLPWLKRKYSEPVFMISEQDAAEEKQSEEANESRGDSFDRFGR